MINYVEEGKPGEEYVDDLWYRFDVIPTIIQMLAFALATGLAFMAFSNHLSCECKDFTKWTEMYSVFAFVLIIITAMIVVMNRLMDRHCDILAFSTAVYCLCGSFLFITGVMDYCNNENESIQNTALLAFVTGIVYMLLASTFLAVYLYCCCDVKVTC